MEMGDRLSRAGAELHDRGSGPTHQTRRRFALDLRQLRPDLEPCGLRRRSFALRKQPALLDLGPAQSVLPRGRWCLRRTVVSSPEQIDADE